MDAKFFRNECIGRCDGNPNLKWQKTLDKNIGVDISLLGNRLNLNMDYFIKDTDPLLVISPSLLP